jgi:hypothetical protein
MKLGSATLALCSWSLGPKNWGHRRAHFWLLEYCSPLSTSESVANDIWKNKLVLCENRTRSCRFCLEPQPNMGCACWASRKVDSPLMKEPVEIVEACHRWWWKWTRGTKKAVRGFLAELARDPKCHNLMTSGVHLQKGIWKATWRSFNGKQWKKRCN